MYREQWREGDKMAKRRQGMILGKSKINIRGRRRTKKEKEI
jgi:hypothetical protein